MSSSFVRPGIIVMNSSGIISASPMSDLAVWNERLSYETNSGPNPTRLEPIILESSSPLGVIFNDPEGIDGTSADSALQITMISPPSDWETTIPGGRILPEGMSTKEPSYGDEIR